ncbi:hypothetical protein DW157_06450 [Bacteroides eggerthii]|nr:hypothetical protein DW157_06450 [Bacteroides eggerthii]
MQSLQSLIYEKNVYKRNRDRNIITNNLKLRDMGNLMKGLKVAAYVAEIVVASSVVAEFVGKYCGKKNKSATGTVKAVDAATENW